MPDASWKKPRSGELWRTCVGTLTVVTDGGLVTTVYDWMKNNAVVPPQIMCKRPTVEAGWEQHLAVVEGLAIEDQAHRRKWGKGPLGPPDAEYLSETEEQWIENYWKWPQP